MYYVIGDIHGSLNKLQYLIKLTSEDFNHLEDTYVFLGDYIDRGEESYEVVETLYNLSKMYRTVFINGNHEVMLYDYLHGKLDKYMYIANGGKATEASYRKQMKSFTIPEHHRRILFSGIYYYERDDFIAVHAGLNPKHGDRVDLNEIKDLIWIRDPFFNSRYSFKKTIFFGHTPTHYLQSSFGSAFIDKNRNIIGIDTAAVYGGKLTCIRWPDCKIYQA